VSANSVFLSVSNAFVSANKIFMSAGKSSVSAGRMILSGDEMIQLTGLVAVAMSPGKAKLPFILEQAGSFADLPNFFIFE